MASAMMICVLLLAMLCVTVQATSYGGTHKICPEEKRWKPEYIAGKHIFQAFHQREVQFESENEKQCINVLYPSTDISFVLPKKSYTEGCQECSKRGDGTFYCEEQELEPADNGCMVVFGIDCRQYHVKDGDARNPC